jgi:hypothetical protein
MGFVEIRINEIPEDVQRKFFELQFKPDQNNKETNAGLVTLQPIVVPRIDTVAITVLRLRDIISDAAASIMDHASSSKLLLTVSLSCP